MTADASPSDVLLTRRVGHVFVVTLNRPAQRNALNFALRSALREAFDLFEDDDDLRCAVLTGEGTVFCAGGDLKEMAAKAVTSPPAEWGLLLSSRGVVSKPVVAAINGPALAGGFRLVQDCDICLANESATFGISEVKRGRGSPWAAPLINMIPQKVMAELLLTGESISAARAFEIGLVNRVVAAEDLVPEAIAVAQTIAGNAPLSVRAAKRLISVSTEIGQTQAIGYADAIYESVYESDDALEGPRAFAEGRAPNWNGR
jgi:enoyl-CoA hydratase/carnithine racemase